MEVCIRRSASRNGIKIIEIGVQPEHVPCVVEVSFKFSKDEGKLLENLVFLEIYRRHKKVFLVEENLNVILLFKKKIR